MLHSLLIACDPSKDAQVNIDSRTPPPPPPPTPAPGSDIVGNLQGVFCERAQVKGTVQITAAKIAEVFSAVVDLLNNPRIEARAQDNNFWL